LYFAEWGNNSIDKVAKANVFGNPTKFPVNSHPQDLVIGPDGFIYFTEPSAGKIGKISTAGTGLLEVTIPGAQPWGIAVGGDKRIWFTDNGGGRVGRVTTSLTGLALFNLPNTTDAPEFITSAPDGNLYVAENSGTSNIAQVQLDGTVTDVLVP